MRVLPGRAHILAVVAVFCSVTTAGAVDLKDRLCDRNVREIATPHQDEYCPSLTIECQVAWEQEVRAVDEYNAFARKCMRALREKPVAKLPYSVARPSSTQATGSETGRASGASADRPAKAGYCIESCMHIYDGCQAGSNQQQMECITRINNNGGIPSCFDRCPSK